MNIKRTCILTIIILFGLIGFVYMNGGFVTVHDLDASSLGIDSSSIATEPRGGRNILFSEVSNKVGLTYTANDSYQPDTNVVTNAGVYAVDYNNDGWIDVLTIGGNRPVLFKNTGGKFHKSDAFPSINHSVQTALFFDYDNDGFPDLLLFPLHHEPIFFENTNGSFKQEDVGLDHRLSIPTGATAADYNKDRCLDLFIIQTGNWTQDPPQGLSDYSVNLGQGNGGHNLLYRGNCSGFNNVTDRAGIRGNHWSLATSFVDLTNDGRPDIHVANDFNRDTIYVNRGNGTFKRRPIGQLLEQNGDHFLGPNTNRNAMSSEISDINGDGYLDLYVTNIYDVSNKYKDGPSSRLKSRGNNLFLGLGNGTFVERSATYGVNKGGWGWSAVVADLDNDGDSDIFHTTMWVNYTPSRELSYQDIEAIYNKHPYYRYPQIFEHTSEGFEMIAPKRINILRSDGRGLVQFDFDRDGDIDLLVADAHGAFKLYENVDRDNTALEITVQGTDSIPATGTQVYVISSNRTWLRVQTTKSDFLSQESRVLHVGTGDLKYVDVVVIWPDGSKQRFSKIRTDQRLIVTPTGIKQKIKLKKETHPEKS